jgi:ribonuclease P protein component
VIGRIQDRTTFERLRVEAQRTRAGELWCAALPDDTGGRPRIAYAIGKRVGTAVVRNRLRRRLKAIAEAHADLVHPGSYLIGARLGAAQCSYEELNAMFIRLFDQVKANRR